MRIDGKHFAQDFTNGSFEIEISVPRKRHPICKAQFGFYESYYQNDMGSIHASEKLYQSFRKESIEVALSNVQIIVQREENDEIHALYGTGNYCLSPEYLKFQVASHV